MIADTINNRNLYSALSPGIKAALDYLAKTDFSAVDPGRYDIDGVNIFALVQSYESIPKEEAKWACNLNYYSNSLVMR